MNIRIAHVLSHLPLPFLVLPQECVVAIEKLIICFKVFHNWHFEGVLGGISLFRHWNEFIQDIINLIILTITSLARDLLA